MAFVGTLFDWTEDTPIRVLSVDPALGGGGGGGGGSSTVTVPGNAADIIERATGSIFSVEEIDENNVGLVMPSFIDSEEDIDTLSSQLLYVFGPASDSDLGWLTVSAKGLLGLADSSDAGGAPDYIPVVGTVVFTPSLSRPIRILATNQFLAVASVTATFDSDGEIAFDGIKNVRLIAPQWTGLSVTDWRWNFEVRPGPGQSWSAFSGNFTGAPGAVINLAAAL